MSQFLEYGELGLAALIVVLSSIVGYKLASKFLDRLATSHRNCHRWTESREHQVEKIADSCEKAIREQAVSTRELAGALHKLNGGN